MDFLTLFLIVCTINSVFYFFDVIFKSCLHYPYLRFLQTSGLSIGFFKITWYTTSFNRTLFYLSRVKPKFLHKWFSLGVIATVLLVPAAVFMLLMSVANVLKKENASSDTNLILEPMVPGFNLPVSDIGYYLVTIAVCSIFHEVGHAIAAFKEGVQICGVGLILVLIIPVAYVEMNSEQLSVLHPKKQLRIFCAGIWHNIVLSLLAYFFLGCIPFLLSPLYDLGRGVYVIGIKECNFVDAKAGTNLVSAFSRANYVIGLCSNDPIFPPVDLSRYRYGNKLGTLEDFNPASISSSKCTGELSAIYETALWEGYLYFISTLFNSKVAGQNGIFIGDKLVAVNDCEVSDQESWQQCLMSFTSKPSPGYCVSEEEIHQLDESIPMKVSEDGTVECCNNSSGAHLCFETLEDGTPLQILQYSCLPGRPIVAGTAYTCGNPRDCPPGLHCIRPVTPRGTALLRIQRSRGNVVIYIGAPKHVLLTVDVSDYVPIFHLFPAMLPEILIRFTKYFVIFSSGLAVLNAIPCFYFDGRHISYSLVNYFIQGRLRYKNLLALSWNIFGMLLLIINFLCLLWKLVNVNY